MRNLLYEKFQLAKEANVFFKEISSLFTLINDEKNLIERFTNPDFFRFQTSIVFEKRFYQSNLGKIYAVSPRKYGKIFR